MAATADKADYCSSSALRSASILTISYLQSSSASLPTSEESQARQTQENNLTEAKKFVRRIRRLSGRNSRPKSFADADELSRNLHNMKLANSAAAEYNSVENLEASQYAASYSRPTYRPYAQVRNSRSLHFSAEPGRARTWNQSDARQLSGARHRLSVSSGQYEDGGDEVRRGPPPASHKEKLSRSKSCDRARLVATLRLGSDKLQANLSRLSSNLSSNLASNLSGLDTSLSSVSCVAGRTGPDWYRPSTQQQQQQQQEEEEEEEEEDPSAGFSDSEFGSWTCGSPTPSTRPPPLFSCVSMDRGEDYGEPRRPGRVARAVRGRIHTANKQLSLLRSRSMERFSRRQEVIAVEPRPRPGPTAVSTHRQQQQQEQQQFLGTARATASVTPNPYDTQALKLTRGDLIDILETAPGGTWLGRSRATNRTGTFKFLNVERVVAGVEAGAGAEQPDCVAALLSSLGMDRFIPVFVLNGYDSLEAAARLDRAELAWLGVVEPLQQQAVLATLASINLPSDHNTGVL